MSMEPMRPDWMTIVMGTIVLLAIAVKCVPNTHGNCIRLMETEARIRVALVKEFVLRLVCILLVIRYSQQKKYFIASCFAVFVIEHVTQEVLCYRQNKIQHGLTSLMELMIGFCVAIYAKDPLDWAVAVGVSLVGISHIVKAFDK